MGGVIVGFAIIAAIIAIGYVVGRIGFAGPSAQFVIGRLVFFVLSPCLLFTVLAEADVHTLFSSLLAVSLIAAVLICAVYFTIARVFWKRPVPEATIGSIASGYTNANNIGLPVAVYVLGNPAYVAPVILLQLILLAPTALTILDTSTSGKTSFSRIVMQPLRNPLLIASALGVILALTGVTLPDAVMQPFQLIGAAAVPLTLIGFGMSLSGSRMLQPGTGRRDVLVASTLKLVAMPIVAFLLGRFAFHLAGEHLFAVVVLAALPTAQNVFNYAQRYGRGVIIARDAGVITTLGSIPVLILVAALLKP